MKNSSLWPFRLLFILYFIILIYFTQHLWKAFFNSLHLIRSILYLFKLISQGCKGKQQVSFPSLKDSTSGPRYALLNALSSPTEKQQLILWLFLTWVYSNWPELDNFQVIFRVSERNSKQNLCSNFGVLMPFIQ